MGQFIQPGAKLQPKKLELCRRELSNTEIKIEAIQKEEDKVKDSYEEITHSQTGEIRKFATEQSKYNLEQIEQLRSLKEEHISLGDKVCAYIDSVEKTFVSLSNTTKNSTLSRHQKESRHKTKKRV